jgi:DNA-binding transcriptional MerR regulator
MNTASPFLTLGQVAQKFNCREWQVRRLYERQLLPPARRAGQYRIVTSEELPAIKAALLQAGYLSQKEVAPCG